MDEKIKAFWAKLNTPIKELWANSKWFLIAFGVLILVVKFREIIISFLVESAKTLMKKTKAKDEQLAGQQNAANDAADALVKKAEDLANKDTDVDKDWHKK